MESTRELISCFSKPIAISDIEGGCIDDDNTTEGAVPAAGLNNEVYVAWAHREFIYFNKSIDGGTTWMPKSKVIMAIPGGLLFAKLLYPSTEPSEINFDRFEFEEKRPGQFQYTTETTVEIEGSEKPAMIAEWITQVFV